MTFKEFKTIHLRRIKVWLWYKWLRLELWWVKKFGKRYTPDGFTEKLNKEIKK